MKKIHLLVLKAYMGPLVFTFFVSLFILLMQFLWQYIDELVGKGLEWYVVTELLFYASSTFVPLALPLAILISSLMTFGNLGEHYELVAMKSSGVSLWKIMRPLIVLSILISGFAFYFSNNVLPVANLKFKSLLYDVRKQKMAFDISEGIFYNGMDGYVMRVGRKDDDDKTIHDVMIYNHKDRHGNIDLTLAEYGTMESTPEGRYLIFTLYNGYNYRENVDQKDYYHNKSFQRTYFKEEIRRFDLSGFELTRTNEELFKNNYQMLNISQLNLAIDSLNNMYNNRLESYSKNYVRYYFLEKLDTVPYLPNDTIDIASIDILQRFNKQEKRDIVTLALNQSRNTKSLIDNTLLDLKAKTNWIVKHKVVWHKKFTLSFACLVLFFIGAPLGAIIRKGGLGLPVVFSIIFFVIFHIISITGEKAARAGAMDIKSGMWLASFVLLPLGIFLTYKATTDSPLMDIEIWTKRIKMFFNWFRRKKDH